MRGTRTYALTPFKMPTLKLRAKCRSGGSQLVQVEGPLHVQALSCEPGLKIYDDIYEAGVFGGMV